MKIRLAVVAASVLLAGQPAQALQTLIGSGTIATTDLVQTGRVLRNSTASTWAAPKAFPGLNDSLPRNYDLINATFEPNAVQDIFYRVTLQSSTFLFVVAYGGPYNPASLGVNYLGDPGSSSATTTFQVLSPAGGSLFLVVNNVGTISTDAAYSFTVESFSDATGGENFATVPEPASWALLIAGFGLVGAINRRRRVRAQAT